MAAWAEIEAARAAGMTIKEIWRAAEQDGLEVSYAQFRVYLSRIRHRRKLATPEFPQAITIGEPQSLPAAPSDPFRNIREQREKKRQTQFEYDPISHRDATA